MVVVTHFFLYMKLLSATWRTPNALRFIIREREFSLEMLNYPSGTAWFTFMWDKIENRADSMISRQLAKDRKT